jgi:hypothetical protein
MDIDPVERRALLWALTNSISQARNRLLPGPPYPDEEVRALERVWARLVTVSVGGVTLLLSDLFDSIGLGAEERSLAVAGLVLVGERRIVAGVEVRRVA